MESRIINKGKPLRDILAVSYCPKAKSYASKNKIKSTNFHVIINNKIVS